MGRVERTREIARRRTRKVKLEQLRAKYAKATGESEKSLILTKARKLKQVVVTLKRSLKRSHQPHANPAPAVMSTDFTVYG